MPKKTLRIPLYPDSPEKFLELAQLVIEHHETLGASSPLNSPGLIDMAAFKQKVEEAVTLRREAEQHYNDYFTKMGHSRSIMGTGKGQTISMPDTIYSELNRIKKLLLVKNPNTPKELGLYGFHVVIDTASVGRPKKK